jgi:hypothetical protein
MTNPKLALIPSGYKQSPATVYSILPNNSDGDFTYERNCSATRVRKDGLIEELIYNTPRLDWLNSNCPSLLLEPQRTNLQAYSENFSGLAWTPALVTITANSSISPNGELTAYKIESDQTNFAAELSGFLQITSNTEYTYSIYVKADTTSICRIELTDNFNSSDYYYGRVTFDMSTETLTTALATASFDKLDGGWYRLKMTATSPNPIQGATRAKIILPEVGSIFIWGAQTEAGGYATSYIKNVDNANGVTRLKDECLNGGDADLFDITEGTFFVDATNFEGTETHIGLSDGTDANKIAFIYKVNGYQLRIYVSSDSVVSLDTTQTILDAQRNKVALTFKENEFKVFINGALVHTDTSGNIPLNFSRLDFANKTGTGAFFEGKVHDTRVYDRVLTEAEAIQLTTI